MNWFLIKSKTNSYTEALQMYKEARAPRDYKREYAQYHSKPQRVAERSQRNKARRKLGLSKGDPREVDHKNPISNGGSNARSNLRAVSLQANREKFTKTARMTMPTIGGLTSRVTRAISTNPLQTKSVADTVNRVADVAAEGAPSMAGAVIGGQIGRATGGRIGGAVHRAVKGTRPAPTSNTAIQAGTHYSTQLNRYGRKYLKVPRADATGKAYTPQQVQAMVDSGQTTPMMANSYNRLITRLGKTGVNKYDAGRQAFINTGEQVGQSAGTLAGGISSVKFASSGRKPTLLEKRAFDSDALTARILNALAAKGVKSKDERPMTKAERRYFNKRFKGKKTEKTAGYFDRKLLELGQPGVDTWRDSSLVEKRAATLYHGSPYEGLTNLQPREPRGNTDYERQKAVFMTDNPDAAALYALARDKERNNKGWAAIGGRLQLGPNAKLNEKGYIYNVDTDDYLSPPKGEESRGFAIPREIGVSGVKEVTPAEYEHLIDRFDSKDAFRDHVNSLINKEASNPRIPRKPGQPANSKKHSDLFTDENPKGTIHGLGFKTPAHAHKSVAKIKGSGKTHAHKTQAAIAMEQRARTMGKTEAANVYRAFIEEQKRITKKKRK